MIPQINKLLDSDYDELEELGRLIYNREDQSGGLNADELDKLLYIIDEDFFESIREEGVKLERSRWM
ncbi:hypothetical protein [Lederbergia lenta]|uniref:hypothetical protein n=1 Tax=Lederbergia lenta TaxID=1467 RepID=UPI00203A5257|nr:hypothetical protein [Lederbergia lenta]MCM3109908.1 hypothetical protein [Lederbergia lenta]